MSGRQSLHPACSMSDCLPSGLCLSGPDQFLVSDPSFRDTNWQDCGIIVVFCSGHFSARVMSFSMHAFRGLDCLSLHPKNQKSSGAQVWMSGKTLDLRPDASSRFGWITASVKGTKHWSQSAWESFLRFGKGKATQNMLSFKMLDLKNQSDLKWHLSDSKRLFVLFNLGPVSLA